MVRFGNESVRCLFGDIFLKGICCCAFGPRQAGFNGNAAGVVYSDGVIIYFPAAFFFLFVCLFFLIFVPDLDF